MRVICSALLSRGAQNEQSLEQGRRFLTENRLSILAVLKKSAGLGTGQKVSEESIDELAECFMVLINVTGFLDVSCFPLLFSVLLSPCSLRNRQAQRDSLYGRSHEGLRGDEYVYIAGENLAGVMGGQSMVGIIKGYHFSILRIKIGCDDLNQ